MEERNIKAAEGNGVLHSRERAREGGSDEAQWFKKRTHGTITYHEADSRLRLAV